MIEHDCSMFDDPLIDGDWSVVGGAEGAGVNSRGVTREALRPRHPRIITETATRPVGALVIFYLHPCGVH